MHPFDRAWLARPILTALGTSSLLGLACGGAVAEGSEYDEVWDMEGDGGSAAQTGSVGGSSNGPGGSGGRAGAGTSGNGGRGGGASTGGVGGAFMGAGGSASFAGSAGAAGFAGAGMGFAGSASMPEPSFCVNLDNGLAGLPDQAAPTDLYTARTFCAGDFVDNMNYQMVCLPQPGNGQSCSNFYPENLVGLLYRCGLQSGATFLCGPRPPIVYSAADGCLGNECCFVLAGFCP